MKRLLLIIICCMGYLGFSQITEAEYFIDNDPGVGSATGLNITSGNSITENFTIPTTGLTTGLHVLHIRVKGTDDVWSLYQRAYFYIHTIETPPVATVINAAEYFVDNDPGIGSATALSITSGFTVNETMQIPTIGLDPGLHVLHIRVKDADNVWSLYKRSYFYIHTVNNENSTPIVAAEYFFDNDPGVGSGTGIAVANGFTSDNTLTITVPANMADGNHYLHLRVLDADGNWSLYSRALFNVDGSLSVENIGAANFQVFPNPTTTILHVNFAIEIESHVELYDTNGKKVLSKPMNELQNTLNISDLSSGIYLLKVTDLSKGFSEIVRVLKF